MTFFTSGLQAGRIKLLICDLEIYEEPRWVHKNATALFPFNAGTADVPNFTAKFSQRPPHLDTVAFQVALKLAHMHANESNSDQGNALAALKLGFAGCCNHIARINEFQNLTKGQRGLRRLREKQLPNP
jgi:hypothetical protein